MVNKDSPPEPSKPSSPEGPRWYQVIMSVLAAGFGVQSKKSRQRDFEHGKPVVFIVTGIIFTFLFIASVMMVVSTVLDKAG